MYYRMVFIREPVVAFITVHFCWQMAIAAASVLIPPARSCMRRNHEVQLQSRVRQVLLMLVAEL